MENLMIKAIKDFKKMKKGEIRSICVYESYGEFNKTIDALFHIEYCEESEGAYKSIDLRVSKYETIYYVGLKDWSDASREMKNIIVKCSLIKNEFKTKEEAQEVCDYLNQNPDNNNQFSVLTIKVEA